MKRKVEIQGGGREREKDNGRQTERNVQLRSAFVIANEGVALSIKLHCV